jgi:hypothetical protein
MCAALGTASGGCERVQAWFGEPAADVEAQRVHAAEGLSFAYPGNWRLREEAGEDVRTIVLESGGEALLLLQVLRPAVAIDLDEHLALTMRTLVADFAGQGGGVEPGGVATFEREWLGERRAARRAAIVVAMPGEAVASAIELYAADLADSTVLVFTMIPDAGRDRAAAGFDLVLDTLAVDVQ